MGKEIIYRVYIYYYMLAILLLAVVVIAIIILMYNKESMCGGTDQLCKCAGNET